MNRLRPINKPPPDFMAMTSCDNKPCFRKVLAAN